MAKTDGSDLPQIKTNSTKKEMLEAYKVAKELLVKQEKTLLDAEKARKDLEKRATLAESQKQESAYEKVQDIASQAVTSAKHEIISIPAASSGSAQTQAVHNRNH